MLSTGKLANPSRKRQSKLAASSKKAPTAKALSELERDALASEQASARRAMRRAAVRAGVGAFPLGIIPEAAAIAEAPALSGADQDWDMDRAIAFEETHTTEVDIAPAITQADTNQLAW